MLKLVFTGQFKKDFKKALKRGCDKEKFETVVEYLLKEEPLPQCHEDHPLQNSRNFKGMRECHIEPDWLLVYKVEKDIVTLKLI